MIFGTELSIRIGCIIVLYNPDMALFKEVLDSVKEQVDGIFISDNSPVRHEDGLLSDFVYEKMPGNVGIAAAQNVGIKYFIKQGFSHIIFLDQDSIMEKGLVAQLLLDMNLLEGENIPVGAIGPRPFHRAKDTEYRGSVKKGKLIRPYITEVTELISSSTLVNLNKYLEIGLLDETLFIDGVDHEWCWRARMKKGLRFFISERVRLSHQLGEGDRFFLVRDVAIPTPFRTYYQFRNFFILLRRNYVPLYWKLANGFKYFVKLFYFPIFVRPRMLYLKNILRGILDGVMNN